MNQEEIGKKFDDNSQRIVIEESRFRSIVKAITWRTIGTIDTIILSFIISGNPFSAFKIGFSEIFTKVILYYFHERVWQKWLIGNKTGKDFLLILKSISWRFWGTIDTTLLSWFYTGNLSLGIKIGTMELFTKIILYYIHEKLWIKVPRGTMRKYFPYLENKRQQFINRNVKKRNTPYI